MVKLSIILVAALILVIGINSPQEANAATFAPNPVNDPLDIEWEVQPQVSTTTEADLSIAKEDSPDPVKVGEELTYHIEITNHGPATSTDVVMRDWLPKGVSLVSASSTPGSCRETDGIVSCQLGDIASGSVATSTIVVIPESAGILRNRASVRSEQTSDPFGHNNRVMQLTHVIDPNAADMSVKKDGNPDVVNVGDKITYTMEVVNHGFASSTNVTLKDKLPGNVTFVSASSSVGSCSFNGNKTVTCDLGNLEMGDFAIAEIEIIANHPGTLVNMARVRADQPDPNRHNNTATEKTRVRHGNSNVFDGIIDRNLDLKNGNFVINGTVNGNVEVTNGRITINGEVKGNLEQKGPGGIIIDGGTVKGNVEEKGPGNIVIKSGTVEGNAEESGPGDIRISDGGTVEGNVEEKGPGDVIIHGSAVKGNVKAEKDDADDYEDDKDDDKDDNEDDRSDKNNKDDDQVSKSNKADNDDDDGDDDDDKDNNGKSDKADNDDNGKSGKGNNGKNGKSDNEKSDKNNKGNNGKGNNKNKGKNK